MKVSAESQKKIDDRREMLKRGVLDKGGKWDEAWIVDGVPRTTGVNSGRLDMYYISPDGKRMRSMSEVYSFLGLTVAPTKSSVPAPTAAHVAAATATAANSGRAVREAKLSASAAITASATNPYPINNAAAISGQKRPRASAQPTVVPRQRGLREVREADARMAAVEPQRWRARLFPIDARARAAVDAYDQSLRESALIDWRRSHNTTVKEYAARVQPVVMQAHQCCMEEALRVEKQCGASSALFPVLRGLVNAFAATGMHAEHVQRATEVLTATEAHHQAFTKEHISHTATLALKLGALKDELTATSTGGDERTEVSRQQLPSIATATAINNARVAAHNAAAAAGNTNAYTAMPGRMTITSAAAASASSAAAAAAAGHGALPPRHCNRPTPPLGSFAVTAAKRSTIASIPITSPGAGSKYPATTGANVPSPVQAKNGAKKFAATLAAANNSAPVMPGNARQQPAAVPAPVAPPSTTAAVKQAVAARPVMPAGTQAAAPTTSKAPAAPATNATATPSAASTQTRSTPAKPMPVSQAVPATAPLQSGGTKGQTTQWPKFGSSDFAAAPEVVVRARSGMLKGRLGNPSVCAHADGSLKTASGSTVPMEESVHYIFTLDGIPGKFAGAGASREERPTVAGDNCRVIQKHPAATPHNESQPEKRTGQCH